MKRRAGKRDGGYADVQLYSQHRTDQAYQMSVCTDSVC